MARPIYTNLQKCTADEIWQCFKQWDLVQAGKDIIGHITALELVRNNTSGYHKNQFFITVRVTENATKKYYRLKWQGFMGVNVVKIVVTPKD